MLSNEITKSIRERRSIRTYSEEPLTEEQIDTILEAGRWAPSGLNNQPWSFAIVRSAAQKNGMALLTSYGRIVRQCRACICVFYHHPSGYNRDKDILSIGACVQNMLLAAHSLGIGSVWLGEILNRREDVNALLCIESEHELMAVIALGYPAEQPRSSRKKISSLLIREA